MGTGLLGAMVPYYVQSNKLQMRANNHPPGLVGTCTHYLGRYREFDTALSMAIVPNESVKQYYMGVDVANNFNSMVENLLANEPWKWLWILGDDHVFTNDLWVNLYERNVDIVVPLCLHRDGFQPVLSYGEDKGFERIPNAWDEIKGKTGLMKWTGTCGNAGMVIRRNVFEKLEFPPFKAGRFSPRFSSSDLYFSYAAQKAGFDVYVDLDNPIGHIEHMAIWPSRSEDGKWHAEIRQATAK